MTLGLLNWGRIERTCMHDHPLSILLWFKQQPKVKRRKNVSQVIGKLVRMNSTVTAGMLDQLNEQLRLKQWQTKESHAHIDWGSVLFLLFDYRGDGGGERNYEQACCSSKTSGLHHRMRHLHETDPLFRKMMFICFSLSHIYTHTLSHTHRATRWVPSQGSTSRRYRTSSGSSYFFGWGGLWVRQVSARPSSLSLHRASRSADA